MMKVVIAGTLAVLLSTLTACSQTLDLLGGILKR